jgi:signal transduction histidine kinase
VYICQLVRDRINQFKQKKTNYGGIEYEVNADVEESTMVRASPEWLRRILDILIDNARNAMQASEVKKISIAIKTRDNGVEMLFSDTGRGIPDHLKASLFKETVKKSRNEKGSGIGLFLANTVVQTYGGRLEIRASGPKGTTMALWLPVSK